MCGVQALAVSLCVKDWKKPADFSAAARLAAHVVPWVAAHPLPLGCLYSLNVPPIPYEEIKGLVPAKLAPVFLGEPCYRPEGEGRYRFEANIPVPMTDSDGDVGLIEQGYATITKLSWDFRLNAPDGDINEIGL